MAAAMGFSRLINYAATTCLRKISPASIYQQRQPAFKLWETAAAGLHTRLPWIDKTPEHQVEICDYTKEKEKITADIVKEINKQISTDTAGRLFAVVHICGKQFKITENDIIIIQGYWPPTPGEEIKLEKVLLVGGKDFTLVGRPLVNRELVSVDATVIEKTFSHTKTRFRMKKRKQFRRINFYRVQHTMLRINSITINGDIDKKKEVEGLDRIY